MVLGGGGGEKCGLGGLGPAAGVVSLGPFAGDAFAVQTGLGDQVKRVRGVTKFMLGDMPAAFGSFHGGGVHGLNVSKSNRRRSAIQ